MCALVTGVQTCALPLFGRGRTQPGFIFCKPILISCYDAVLLQREANFIQSFRQAMLTERIDGKLKSILKRRGDALRVEIDVNGIGFRHLKQQVDGLLRQRDCPYAILERRSEEAHTSELQSLMRISYAV